MTTWKENFTVHLGYRTNPQSATCIILDKNSKPMGNIDDLSVEKLKAVSSFLLVYTKRLVEILNYKAEISEMTEGI